MVGEGLVHINAVHDGVGRSLKVAVMEAGKIRRSIGFMESRREHNSRSISLALTGRDRAEYGWCLQKSLCIEGTGRRI